MRSKPLAAGIRAAISPTAPAAATKSSPRLQPLSRTVFKIPASVVPIRVPALRERPHDIRLLAEYFLEDFCARNNFKPKMLDGTVFPSLETYAWPGNARELRNVIERMAILTASDRIARDSIARGQGRHRSGEQTAG